MDHETRMKADHPIEKAALQRTPVPRHELVLLSNPWGPAQAATRYAEGIVEVQTASHGGFLLDPERLALVDPRWRVRGNAFEEDIVWAIVAHSFPALFTTWERASAERTLRRWLPREYMEVTGKTIPIEESHVLQEEALLEEHASDWITTSARMAPDGKIEATAHLGRDRSAPARRYRIEADRYGRAGAIGYIIDPDLDERIDEDLTDIAVPLSQTITIQTRSRIETAA